jgi:hypothetical protein
MHETTMNDDGQSTSALPSNRYPLDPITNQWLNFFVLVRRNAMCYADLK